MNYLRYNESKLTEINLIDLFSMFTDEDIQKIQDHLRIEDLVSKYVDLKAAGKYQKGLCPFHSEKTPSFTVSPDKNIFHCFGCGEGGNIFHFYMKISSCSFPEAVNALALQAGIEINDSQFSQMKEKHFVKQEQTEIIRQAAWFYHKKLKDAPEHTLIKKYLKDRKIKIESIETFFLGWAEDKNQELFSFLKSKGFKENQILKAGLIREHKGMKKDFFRSRLIFPIFAPNGKIVGLGGRIFEKIENAPKYLNSAESEIFKKGKLFYGLKQAKASISEKHSTLLCEGYLDVISLSQAGFENCIAPLGTAFTEDHAQLLKKMDTKVILAFDGDQAGKAASYKALKILIKHGIFPQYLQFPPGEDPDTFIKNYGKIAFEKLLEESNNLLNRIIDNITTRCGNDPASKGQAVKEIMPWIELIPDPLQKKLYLKKISDTLEIPLQWLDKNLDTKTLKSFEKRALKAHFSVEEDAILSLWFAFPKLRFEMNQALKKTDFVSVEAAKLFEQCQEAFLKNPEGEMLNLPQDLSRRYSKLMLAFEEVDNLKVAQNHFKQSYQKLLEQKLKQDLKEMQNSHESDVFVIKEKIEQLSRLKKERNEDHG